MVVFLFKQKEVFENKKKRQSEKLELDPTGSIKLALPTLGTYTIKVNSKDQYGLTQKAEFKTIKNFVKTIDILKGSAEKDIYLWSETNQTTTFGTKSFMIDPATPQEKNNVKWLVYDKNGAIYIPEGFALQIENSDAQKPYLAKGETFVFPIPKKEGSFTIEAYSNSKEGLKSKSSRKIEVIHPKVTEAYWAYNNGAKRKTSGLSGEINHIKAHVLGYINQPVRVLCFLNDSTVVNYYNDTTTNENGEINKTLKFDAAFQKRFGIQSGKTAKIRFELEGLQDGKPYLFKKNPSVYNDAVLHVTTSAKITDAYFMYEGNRVTAFTQVPYGKKVTGVVKTLNMVGKTVTMKIYDGTIKPSVYRGKVVVNPEGVASREIVLDKKWHKTNFLQNHLNDSYYVGLEELESKLSLENGLSVVVGDTTLVRKKKTEEKSSDIKLQEARIRAFLRMIRVGEGTSTNRGYEKIFGGSSFIEDYKKTWEDHPGIVIKAKGKDSKGKDKTYYSSASGAYQIKKDIWDDWGKKFREFYDIKDFSPESQDKFALIILKHKRGKDVIRLIREDKIEDAVKLCQGEWASLPDSPHGQPTVTWKTVMTEYNNFLKEELNGKSPLSIKSGFLKDLGYGDNQKIEILNDVILKFTGSTANKKDLSFKTINILKEVASVSKNFNVNVTSTKRATYDQARIMYENCKITGGKYQKDKVYKGDGDKIIEVYILEAEINKKEKEIVIKKMEEKIIEVGSENVSKHLGNYIFLETFDIQYSNLPNPKDLKKRI